VSEELLTLARNKAGSYFREGYNCAEAVFLACHELLSLDIDRDFVRLTSGLGGGFGHAGCACGALTGSILVLGALKGRTGTDLEARDQIYDLAARFHDVFEDKFGSTCCRSLNPYPYDSREHLKNCLKITGNTGKLLFDFLIEQGLINREIENIEVDSGQ